MSTEAIQESEFLREFTREMRNKNAAVFAGAGLSMASGYVDWKGLLRDVIRDLGLSPEKEHDLVTLAQYYCNQSGGNRTRLAQTLFDHFRTTKTPTVNHRILALLPIYTFWTTNYDKLIEKALEEAKKIPDVKHDIKQLTVTRQDRDVAVYKMHGDVDSASEAVITKEDYEAYPSRMEPFVSALRGDLIEKTFLFLGFSFTDPNIDYILSRVRVRYGNIQRQHYCIQKNVSRNHGESAVDFKHRQLKQHYFIQDLKRFGILTVLVNDYPDITVLLHKLAACYKLSSIFISGAAESYGTWTPKAAEQFLHDLGKEIVSGKNRLITGFGVGVGSAVLNGALEHLDNADKTVSDHDVILRPFPQVATGGKSLTSRWTDYRRAMIDYAGIAVFVFGNKKGATGIVPSNGMREEFEQCIQAGVKPLPIGATGFMAKTLWKEVSSGLTKHFPSANKQFIKEFKKLGDETRGATKLLATIQKLVEQIQKG
ncbi:MAG: SIR2 family protein [Nitrospirales bacterium]|nr:SIR2 family protein [Nitrospirales bacterium]